MAETLVIVESPSKAKTIEKYLGSKYRVIASNGHVRDLPKSQLGVDVEHDFEPKYITLRGRGEVIEKIRKEAKHAKHIVLATDPDREGEAISWHLAKMLKLDENEPCRVVFNEITKTVIQKAVKNPRCIDRNLVDAQQARRVLDRIVGYQLSPLLWKKIRRGLSAGRVQSVATRMVVDREKEIRAFQPKEYWSLDVTLNRLQKPGSFVAHYHGEDKKRELENETQVDEIIRDITDQVFTVKSVKRAEKKLKKYGNVRFAQADITKLDYPDGSFDAVVAANVIHLLDEPYRALAELDRVCKPGGRLIIPTYMNRTDRGTTNSVSGAIGKAGADFKREFTPETYRRFFAAAGYTDARYALCRGRIPCTVAVLQKNGG